MGDPDHSWIAREVRPTPIERRTMLAKLNEYAKAAIAVVGFLLVAATTSSALLGDQAPAWLPAAIAGLTAVAVYLKRNVPA